MLSLAIGVGTTDVPVASTGSGPPPPPPAAMQFNAASNSQYVVLIIDEF